MSEITMLALDAGINAMMRDRFGILARSISCTRENVMMNLIQEIRPDWWLNYRNENWERRAYLRRRRGWAPK